MLLSILLGLGDQYWLKRQCYIQVEPFKCYTVANAETSGTRNGKGMSHKEI